MGNTAPGPLDYAFGFILGGGSIFLDPLGGLGGQSCYEDWHPISAV